MLFCFKKIGYNKWSTKKREHASFERFADSEQLAMIMRGPENGTEVAAVLRITLASDDPTAWALLLRIPTPRLHYSIRWLLSYFHQSISAVEKILTTWSRYCKYLLLIISDNSNAHHSWKKLRRLGPRLVRSCFTIVASIRAGWAKIAHRRNKDCSPVKSESHIQNGLAVKTRRYDVPTYLPMSLMLTSCDRINCTSRIRTRGVAYLCI